MVEQPDAMATLLAFVTSFAPFVGLFGPHITLVGAPFAAIGGIVIYLQFR